MMPNASSSKQTRQSSCLVKRRRLMALALLSLVGGSGTCDACMARVASPLVSAKCRYSLASLSFDGWTCDRVTVLGAGVCGWVLP